jgi:hypothetical protein
MIDANTISFRKYFYIAIIISGLLIASFICLVGAILMMGGYVDANVVEQSIMGTGDLYTSHDTAHASDLASAVNSTVVYQAKHEWDVPGTPETFTSSYIVSGAQANGGFRNQYVVKSSGAGYKHVYRATAISGDFAGSGDVSLTTGGDGAESLDSLILMDSRSGNATFQGRIYNSQSGRPVTAEEMDAVGKFAIRSYLNVSQPITTPAGWLDFCAGLNKIIDPAVAPGVYTAPPGYAPDSTGNLVVTNATQARKVIGASQ